MANAGEKKKKAEAKDNACEKGCVTIFDKANKLVSRLGDEPADRPKGGNNIPPAKWVDGAVYSIHGLTFDPKGALYAMEYTKFGRVSKFTPVK